MTSLFSAAGAFLIVALALVQSGSVALANVPPDPRFDAVVTRVNGVPVEPTNLVIVNSGSVVRVELRLILPHLHDVQSASCRRAPLLELHAPCNFGGDPCALPERASASSGSATAGSQAAGIVGAMGATSFRPCLVYGTHTLGVVHFDVNGVSEVEPFVQFSGIDGTFTNFGMTAVPFTIGPGVIALRAGRRRRARPSV